MCDARGGSPDEIPRQGERGKRVTKLIDAPVRKPGLARMELTRFRGHPISLSTGSIRDATFVSVGRDRPDEPCDERMWILPRGFDLGHKQRCDEKGVVG